jgi:hypothetical protein
VRGAGLVPLAGNAVARPFTLALAVASDPGRREHRTVTRGRSSRGAAPKVADQADRRTTKTHGGGHLTGLIALIKLNLPVGVVSKLF